MLAKPFCSLRWALKAHFWLGGMALSSAYADMPRQFISDQCQPPALSRIHVKPEALSSMLTSYLNSHLPDQSARLKGQSGEWQPKNRNNKACTPELLDQMAKERETLSSQRATQRAQHQQALWDLSRNYPNRSEELAREEQKLKNKQLAEIAVIDNQLDQINPWKHCWDEALPSQLVNDELTSSLAKDNGLTPIPGRTGASYKITDAAFKKFEVNCQDTGVCELSAQMIGEAVITAGYRSTQFRESSEASSEESKHDVELLVPLHAKIIEPVRGSVAFGFDQAGRIKFHEDQIRFDPEAQTAATATSATDALDKTCASQRGHYEVRVMTDYVYSKNLATNNAGQPVAVDWLRAATETPIWCLPAQAISNILIPQHLMKDVGHLIADKIYPEQISGRTLATTQLPRLQSIVDRGRLTAALTQAGKDIAAIGSSQASTKNPIQNENLSELFALGQSRDRGADGYLRPALWSTRDPEVLEQLSALQAQVNSQLQPLLAEAKKADSQFKAPRADDLRKSHGNNDCAVSPMACINPAQQSQSRASTATSIAKLTLIEAELAAMTEQVKKNIEADQAQLAFNQINTWELGIRKIEFDPESKLYAVDVLACSGQQRLLRESSDLGLGALPRSCYKENDAAMQFRLSDLNSILKKYHELGYFDACKKWGKNKCDTRLEWLKPPQMIVRNGELVLLSPDVKVDMLPAVRSDIELRVPRMPKSQQGQRLGARDVKVDVTHVDLGVAELPKEILNWVLTTSIVGRLVTIPINELKNQVALDKAPEIAAAANRALSPSLTSVTGDASRLQVKDIQVTGIKGEEVITVFSEMLGPNEAADWTLDLKANCPQPDSATPAPPSPSVPVR